MYVSKMVTNIDIRKIAPYIILVTAIFSGVMVEWQFDKDWTTLSRDGKTIADSKWVAEAERTYININSDYRNYIMCPRIIADGGYETDTRCYYAPDTYELLSRSLINTKIESIGNEVLKTVPFYAYGTRGSYAGFITEHTVFKDTDNIEDFPDSYDITWEPKDTRNYKLIWRLEKLDTSNYVDGGYVQCEYTFGNVKIDLEDECDKLMFTKIDGNKATFYFKPERGIQDMDISFVDPEYVEKELVIVEEPKGLSMSMPESWRITDIDDTEVPYDVKSVSYDGNTFKLNIKAHDDLKNIPKDATSISPMVLEQNLTGKDLKLAILNLPSLKNRLNIKVKDNNRGKDIDTVNFFDDYNRTTGTKDYSFEIPADYEQIEDVIVCTEENICDVEERLISYKRDKVVFKLGEESIYVTAELETDLKVVQTGLANDTDYTASIDVGNGKLFMGQTNSSYDLTDGIVLWSSFDNVDNGTVAWDYSGNNLHGTMTGMNINLDNESSGWASNGNLLYSIDFDGINDYIDYGNSINLNITDAITISVWINLYEKQSGGIVSKDADKAYELTYWGAAADFIQMYLYIDGSTENIKTPSFTTLGWNLNEWHHIVFTYDGINMILYTDNTQQTPSPTTGTINVSDVDLLIGKRSASANYLNGSIDDVRIWNKALSVTEISALHNLTALNYETKVSDISGSTIDYDVISNTNTSLVIEIPQVDTNVYFTPTYVAYESSRSTDNDGGNNGLIGSWDFNYPTGSIAFDGSGNSNPGTISGAVFTDDTHNNTGYAMEFDGSNDYVIINTNVTDDVLSEGCISFWMNSYNNSIVGDKWIMLENVPTAENPNIFMGRPGYLENKLRFRLYNGTDFKGMDTDVIIIENIWHFQSFTWNTTGIYHYQDGVFNKTVLFSGFIPIGFKEFTINGGSNNFEGSIDNVQIWNRELSASEIADHYSNDLPRYKNITLNTTDSSWFNQETITVTENYLGEANLTKIRVNNPYSISKYDTYNINLSAELSFPPNDIIDVWYDSYTGNSDDATLKVTTDYSQWVDTCKSGNTTGQVLCANFNEIYGTIAHNRANNSVNDDCTLTNMNTGVDNDSSGWIRNGYLGNAIKFDGSNDYIDCGNDSNINLRNFTWMFWININTWTDWDRIMSKGITNDYGISLQLGNDDKIHLYVSNVTTQTNINTDIISLGDWNHITITINNDSQIIEIYQNGIFKENDTAFELPDLSDKSFTIGARYGGSYSVDATIDEVKVFNRALSADEILEDYNLKKDYYDHLINAEGNIAANENLDIFVTNGTVSTCPCPDIGNWGINCNDNCSLWACNINEYDVTVSGTGITTGIRNITNYTNFIISGGCEAYA